ncbi:MAG: LysM peptidoglycan-binding domain-containing protein, partial [Anaerolineae bacterium]|nr:LysM peptidoglycan-binding domain-containing protein [Anaerolineae bacterium]
DGDASLGEVVVGADGTWSWDGTLDPGDHQLTARTVDEAGETVNESPALALAVPEAAEGTVTPSEPGAGEGYIVQPGDSLAALAERFYGDWSLWRLIFQATNERAAEDPSFHVIENPRLIRPGWKLWIPAR